MLQHLEDLDFPHGRLLDYLVLLGLLELLDGHHVLIVVALALQHHPVCALPDHAQNIVFLHQLQ